MSWSYLSACAEMNFTILTSTHVDIFASKDKLAVTSEGEFKPGDGLLIRTEDDEFSVYVLDAIKVKWGRHNWILDVKSHRIDELRKALTYKIVAGVKL